MIDPTQALQQAKDALDKAIEDKRRIQDFVKSIGPAIIDTLKPILNEIASNSRLPKDELLKAISNIKIPDIKVPEPNVTVNAPSLPAFPKIPEPKVTVNVPPIKIPEIKMPEEMDIRGWVQLQGVNLQNPLPVQLRDAKGRAVNLFENLTTLIGGGGGGFRTVSIDGTVPITTGSTLIVDQVSGANWSVNIGASTVIVDQLSGATWSVIANNPQGQGDAATALRVVVAGNSDVSVNASQVGTWTVALSGALSSAVAVGPSAVGVVDDGNAPLQSGGIARTTNPTKVTDGQVVKSTHDAIGRQLIRPVQVRGLVSSAYVSITNGTETTLLAGVAGVYLDLIYLMGTNNSDAAVTVDIRAVTAGNIQTSIRIPANGTAGVSLPVPIPQDETGNNWTADLPDITGTTVTLSALFSREL